MRRPGIEPLSSSQRQLIVRLRAAGWKLADIGREVGRTHNTVRYHLRASVNPAYLHRDIVAAGAGL